MSARKSSEEIGMFLFEEGKKLELLAKIFTLGLFNYTLSRPSIISVICLSKKELIFTEVTFKTAK